MQDLVGERLKWWRRRAPACLFKVGMNQYELGIKIFELEVVHIYINNHM